MAFGLVRTGQYGSLAATKQIYDFESEVGETIVTTSSAETAVPTHVTSLEDSLAVSVRLRQQKAAHRAASAWITRDELIRLAHGNMVLVDSIFEEIQAILQRS